MTDDEWAGIKGQSPEMRELHIKMWRAIRAKVPITQDEKVKPTTPKAVQLPLWPEAVRASPNAFLRSAVFSAIHGRDYKKHDRMRRQVIAAQHGYEIRFTGDKLNQADFDCWLHAAHLARCSPLGTVCIVSYNGFLKGINRSGGGSSYEWLKGVIIKLRSSVLEIKVGSQWCTYNLLEGADGDDDTTLLRLQFSPLLIKLFAADTWTSVQWEERLKLRGKPLALWLHGYYASHANPYPIKISTLRDMCGSNTRECKHFTAALKRAFAQLEKACGIQATFDGDLVTVGKTPSPTQARHIVKKGSLR